MASEQKSEFIVNWIYAVNHYQPFWIWRSSFFLYIKWNRWVSTVSWQEAAAAANNANCCTGNDSLGFGEETGKFGNQRKNWDYTDPALFNLATLPKRVLDTRGDLLSLRLLCKITNKGWCERLVERIITVVFWFVITSSNNNKTNPDMWGK